MEFWGVEVKPKESVKCVGEPDKLLHLSQASLGEIKKDKRTENVPVFVKINEQKLVLGTLSQENCAQIQYDLVFEKEFELSHGSKDTSVFFVGYKSTYQDHGSEDDISDSDSDEELQIGNKAIENAMVKSNDKKTATGKVVAGKDGIVYAKAKPQTGKADKVEKPKFDDDKDDEDEEDESEDDDEEMPKGIIDSDDDEDDDEDDSSEDDEPNLKKTENDKKRSADGVLKPSAIKKAKATTQVEKQKTGDAKKVVKPAASGKQGGKTPASADKAKQSAAKSNGSFKCSPCNKSFNSDKGLEAHTKAKHSAAK